VSTAIETVRAGAPVARELWETDLLALVVNEYMRTPEDTAPPTPAEVDMFAARCRATGMDPFGNQIYAIYRKDRHHPLRRRLTIQTAIDGLRLIAQRTGEMNGNGTASWLDRDGQWLEAWVGREYPPEAARFVVYRKGAEYPFTGVVTWQEYAPTYDGKPQGLWQTKGAHQLSKCAEALALRRAFPNDLAGVYADEEMAQADTVVPPEVRAEREREATERAGDERISREQIAEIGTRTRAAGATLHELKAVLVTVAGVESRAEVPQRHYAAVLAAIDAMSRPATGTPGPTVGAPEVVASGEVVEDAEAVDPDPTPEAPAADANEPDGPPADGAAVGDSATPSVAGGGGGAEAGAGPDAGARPPADPLPLGADDADAAEAEADPLADSMYGPGAP